MYRLLKSILFLFLDDSDMEDKITLRWQGLLVGGSAPKDEDALANLPSFIGSMQQFILNKVNYFDLAKISARGCKCHCFVLNI